MSLPPLPLRPQVLACTLLGALLIGGSPHVCFSQPWQVGFAKADITPTEPVRLSGYASRTDSHVRVADPLSARALILFPSSDAPTADALVLVSIDSIAVTNAITMEVAGWLEQNHNIPRSQLVLSSTHSHAAPHLSGGLRNLFAQPSTPEQQAATDRYTVQVIEAVEKCIAAAIESRRDANIEMGQGTADIAVNRRVLRDGIWSGFGVQADGVVDRRVRVLRCTAPTGELIGGAYLYACHCTSLGPSFNAVSGDWAGLSASRLESLHPGCVFLPIIGCGADANPEPRDSYAAAEQHAAAMVDAVQHVLKTPRLDPLTTFPTSHFGFAGLIPERPTSQQLDELASSDNAHAQRWAEAMQQVLRDMGRIPESYPMPIHTWQFGDALTWIFLGGEVVADYQFAIAKLMPTKKTWVAAYCDDVFAYVASEKMLAEGGYEVDRSMLYYLQPGRWESGTQALIERRVVEILQQERSDDKPLTAEQALAAIRVPEGFRVEMVASEPLVQDPINLAFGPDGRVWVVEMSDYPLGTRGGGRIKWLRDQDGDGQLDEAHVFLQDLNYPTSVMPWRDGALIIAAPDVIYAEDINGDGIADRRETLLTGIGEANPQHRASGFEWGLDGWLHFATGDETHQLHSLRNGQTYEVEGHDAAWNPESGEIRLTTGATQFVPGRDAFDTWFGNSNSYPMYQYVIEQRYLLHGSVQGGTRQHLLEPAAAPPVHPRSRTVDRFNDQFARNRFTSACSSIMARVPGILTDDDPSNGVGFICEPVHNLVARIRLQSDGCVLSATSHPDDTEFDFFTSTDLWSRPVRAINAPDGSLWIVDMVRRVIEHPQWIPTAWQERLDLRSGAQLGRIYRVYRDDFQPTTWTAPGTSSAELLPRLASQNGVVRDLAVQSILQHPLGTNSVTPDLERDLHRVAQEFETSAVRASVLGCLQALGRLTTEDICAGLSASDPALVAYALRLCEGLSSVDTATEAAIRDVVTRNLGPRVDLQWILTSTLLTDFDASAELAVISNRLPGDAWIEKAMSLVMGEKEALTALQSLFVNLDARADSSAVAMESQAAVANRLWTRLAEKDRQQLLTARLEAIPSADAFRPSDILFLSLAAEYPPAAEQLTGIAQSAVARLLSSHADTPQRILLASLLGSQLLSDSQRLHALAALLERGPHELRTAAIQQIRNMPVADVGGVALKHWPQLTSSDRSLLSVTLLQRNPWAMQLLDELESGQIPASDLDPVATQQLRSHPDKTIQSRAAEFFGRPSPRAPLVAQYLEGLNLDASDQALPGAGRKLFEEHCRICHLAVEGRPALGPAIDNLGHWSPEQWVTAILDPNQAVEPKFQQSIAMTDGGQVIAGIVIEKSSQALKLATADGRTQEIPVAELEGLKPSGISLMPEGFEQKLTPAQVGQLISFLRGR